MIFSYLQEFWNSITSAVVSGTTYTVEFFRNIGNAVAGATGNILIIITQPIVDFFMVVGYFFSYFIQIVVYLGSIPSYLFNFIYAYLTSLPNISYSGQWNNQAVIFLNSLPFWNIVGTIVGSALCAFLLIYAWKFARS